MIEPNHTHLSVRAQCHLLDLNRSSLYYEAIPLGKDTALCNQIAEIYESTPQYGYRRIHAQLGREGVHINRKKVQRLMKELSLHAIYPKPKTTIRGDQDRVYPYLLSKLKIIRPHQVWQVDITYLRLPGGFVYLVALIDVYSRVVVGWRLSNSLSRESVLEALEDAVWRYGFPEIINSDQGVQFTSEDWEVFCTLNKIQISMSHKGGSTDNAYVERFWRTLKYEGFYLEFPETMCELKVMLSKFIRWYNEERLHSCLNYVPPLEFLRETKALPRAYMDNFQSKLPTYTPAPHQQQKIEI